MAQQSSKKSSSWSGPSWSSWSWPSQMEQWKKRRKAKKKAKRERLNEEWRQYRQQDELLRLKRQQERKEKEERERAKSELPLLSAKIALHCFITYSDLQDIEPLHTRKMMMLTAILNHYKMPEITGRGLEALAEEIYTEVTDSLLPQGLKVLMEKHVVSLVEHTIVRYLSYRFKWELTYLERRTIRKTVRKMLPS